MRNSSSFYRKEAVYQSLGVRRGLKSGWLDPVVDGVGRLSVNYPSRPAGRRDRLSRPYLPARSTTKRATLSHGTRLVTLNPFPRYLRLNTTPVTREARLRRALLWFVLFVVAGLTFVGIATPVKILMPFSPQSEPDLKLALALRAWSPVIGIAGLAAVLVLGALLRRGSRWWGKTAYVLVFAFVGFVAWFGQKNHFEWRFQPIKGTDFVATDAVDFVTPEERVLAVNSGGESVAYPIRQVSYHHVVHDVVGGTPVVVTY
jgi:hypothetical protein